MQLVLTHSPNHLLTHSPNHLPTHSVYADATNEASIAALEPKVNENTGTHLLTYSLAYSLTHSLTHLQL